MYATLQVYGVFHNECALKAMRESTVISAPAQHEYNPSVKSTDKCWYCDKTLGEIPDTK